MALVKGKHKQREQISKDFPLILPPLRCSMELSIKASSVPCPSSLMIHSKGNIIIYSNVCAAQRNRLPGISKTQFVSAHQLPAI
jgi:hypothetical protein